MTRLVAAAAFAVLTALVPATTSAQLLAAKDGPIVYGHHHLNASNADNTRKFFVDTLGGTVVKVGTNNVEVIRFPNVLIFMRPNMPPSGGTKGTTVDHIGFSVTNLRQVLDKVKANGYRVVTREEAAPTVTVTDDIVAVPGNGPISGAAYVMAPDNVKVELLEMRAQATPTALHHVHFFGPKNAEMREWYDKVFGAKPRPAGGAFLVSDLPGVALNFSPSTEPVVSTKGRALDHIGFEVKNLEAFTRQLAADGIKLDVTYRKIPGMEVSIAFITDPWGTSIELSEGLAGIP